MAESVRDAASPKAPLSRELKESPKCAEHKAALDALLKRIESGEDLTPHLSRAIKTAHDSGADRRQGKLAGRKDRDLLIADWGIHHLHLSTTLEEDGFVKRTSDLLFAAFTPEDAYLINVYPHGSWALMDVLETLVRNWAESGILTQAAWVNGLTQRRTDEDRLRLRNSGVAQPVEIDGKVYSPPGQTTAGTPIAATRRADALMWDLRHLRDSAEGIVALLNEAAESASPTGMWKAVVHEEWCGFLNDGVFVPVRPLA